MANALQDLSISSEEMDALASTADPSKNSVSGMSDREIKDHLLLCMKLSAENKITFKNAFGLHLIGILPLLAKDKETDLKTASLSLQASSKIYCGRVDALYKETFQFHNHLQTILSDGKKGGQKGNQDADGVFGDEDGPNEKGKTSQKKKFKSYVATEESISITNQADKITSKPHQNFELVKSAFSGMAMTKKLLNCLRFESDSCEMSCARSSKIYKPKRPVTATNYTLTKAEKNLWQKMSDWEVSPFNAMEMSGNLLHSPNQSLPVGLDGSFLDGNDQMAPAEFNGNSPIGLDMGADNDSLVIENANASGDETGLHILNERLGALDITACSFANDISQALNRDGSINPALLPPQSTLRKVLKTAEKANLRKEVATEKKKREVKIREPFFRGQEIDKAIFMPGKRTVLTDAAIAEWDKSETTELGTGFDAFNTELNSDPEKPEDNEDLHYDIMAATVPFFPLKNPFFKKPAWKLFREMNRPIAPAQQEDSPGIFRRVQSLAPPPEHLVESFRNLTINDSFDGNGDAPDDFADASVESEQVFLSDFADDIQLVAPPELVKPINVRPQQKAINFDTQKVKQNMWSIISTQLEANPSIMFSDVCNELNKGVKSKDSDNIAWQFAFVMLLVLANEKVLLIENVDEGKDLIVSKDVAEVDVSQI